MIEIERLHSIIEEQMKENEQWQDYHNQEMDTQKNQYEDIIAQMNQGQQQTDKGLLEEKIDELKKKIAELEQ